MKGEPYTFFSNSYLANGESPFVPLSLKQHHFIQRTGKVELLNT